MVRTTGTLMVVVQGNPAGVNRRVVTWTSLSARARHSSATLRRGQWQTASVARLGYIVEKTGESQRIVPHLAVAQRFEVSSSGGLYVRWYWPPIPAGIPNGASGH